MNLFFKKFTYKNFIQKFDKQVEPHFKKFKKDNFNNFYIYKLFSLKRKNYNYYLSLRQLAYQIRTNFLYALGFIRRSLNYY